MGKTPYVAKRFSKSKSAKKTDTKKTKKPKTSNELVTKSMLYKVLNKTIETKFASVQYTYTTFNSAISNIADFLAILPAVQAGTGQNQRIGNSIHPVKLEIRGYITVDSNTLWITAQEILCRLMCFQQKDLRSFADLASGNFNLLNVGGGSGQYDGSLLRQCMPHNNDAYTFYKDLKHTFFKPYGLLNSSITPVSSMNSSLVLPFHIVLTPKHMPSVFKYDSNVTGANYPDNFCPFLALGYCFGNNQTPDVTNTQLGMSYVSTLYYKDA